MKIFSFIVPFFRLILVVFVVAFLYVSGLDPGAMSERLTRISLWIQSNPDPFFYIRLSILILLCELGYCIQRMRQRRKSRFITFDEENGKVSLSVQAIEEFIGKISKGYPEIKQIEPKVFSSKYKINVFARIIYLSGHNVVHFSDNFKRNVRSQLQHILGLERTINIQLSIDQVDEDKHEVFQDKVFQGLEVH